MPKKKSVSKSSSVLIEAEEAPKKLTTSPLTITTPASLPERGGVIKISIASNGDIVCPTPDPRDFGFDDFIKDYAMSRTPFADRVTNPLYVYLFAIEMMHKIDDDPSKLSVLDIGCADGVFEFMLQRDYGILADGVEISAAGRREFKLNIGREALDDIRRITNGMWDVVVAIETIEHVPDHVGLLNDMWSKTKKAVIFTVPREGALDSPDHKHIFNFYDIYDLCDKLDPKPRDFGIYQINKFTKFGNPLNVFGVVVYR